MTHIVFNASEVNLLKGLIKLDEGFDGDVIRVKDDFAVGPLVDIETAEGWNARVNWWRELLKNSPYENDPVTFLDDRDSVQTIHHDLSSNNKEPVGTAMALQQ